GTDDWIGMEARTESERKALAAVAAPGGLPAWIRRRSAGEAAATLAQAGVPAAALARSGDLVADAHLQARGFWDPPPAGVLTGLPWQASFGRKSGPAPDLGADTEAVLQDGLGLTPADVLHLRQCG